MTRLLEYRTKVDGEFLNADVLSSTAWVSKRDGVLPVKLELVLRQKSVVERIEIAAHDLHTPQRVAIATSSSELGGSEKKLGYVCGEETNLPQNLLQFVLIVIPHKVLERTPPSTSYGKAPEQLIVSNRTTSSPMVPLPVRSVSSQPHVMSRIRRTHNKEVDFKPGSEACRQLRTVYVDVVCAVVLLHIHKAHEDNTANPFQQVGLARVLIFGRYESLAEPDTIRPTGTGSSVRTASGGRFTAEIDELLRRLNRNKEMFVTEMDLSQAKRTQLELNLLRKAREEMHALECDQTEAIKEEDFHRALDLQHEIKTLRGNVLASVDQRLVANIRNSKETDDIHRPKNLFDKADSKIVKPKLFTPIDLSPTDSLERIKVRRAVSTSDSMGKGSTITQLTRVPSSPSILLRTGSAPSSAIRLSSTLKERPSSAASKTTMSSRSVARSAPSTRKAGSWQSNKFLEKENTVVPALKDKMNHISSTSEDNEMSNQEEYEPSPPLKESVDHLRAIELLGQQTVENLYSKKWQERKKGLASVQQRLESVPSAEASKYLYSIIPILQKHLRDPLYNVYASALELLYFICTRFMVNHQLQRMAPSVARALHSIIATRANDIDRRCAAKTLSTMDEIVGKDNKLAKAFLTRFLKPVARGSQRGQAVIVRNAADLLGTPNAKVGLTEDAVAQFGLDCLKNADPEVRNLGKKLILDVYAGGRREHVFKIVSDEERMHQHPLLRSVLDDMVAMNSLQARRASETSQSSTGSKSPSTKSVRISDDLPKRNEDAPTSCQHCGANFESPPSNLDMENHYRNKCPLFTKCDDCSQVLMVSSVASHRRNECRARDNYRTCPRCGESIERSLFHRHVGRKDCRPAGSHAGKCPLCTALISPDNEESWTKHLTTHCKENPRRRIAHEIKRNSLNSSYPLSASH